MNGINRLYSLFPLALVLGAALGLLPVAIAGPNSSPPPQASVLDYDDDGVLNDDEAIVGTHPDNPDSDGDGIRDGVDPDILAFYVGHLPDSAFKSKDKGLRTAIVQQLASNERYILDGKIDTAIDQLQLLRKHMDGCPSKADKDDWIVDCASQQTARRILDLLLANHVTIAIDNDLELPVAAIPGLNGGPERPVGVVMGSQDSQESFVANEVVLRRPDQLALDAFLAKYEGVVLRDGTAVLLPGSEPHPSLPASTGRYLIRINPAASMLEDLVPNLEKNGIRGNWSFSSVSAARTAAIVARESDLDISLNFTMQISTHPVLEHPDNSGGNLDASTWPWMTEDDDPGTPGDQGLSIGIVHAWEYVQYKGYPPTDTPYVPLKVAIIDAGFDLDEVSGQPLYGAGDFPFALQQFDAIDYDLTAGGAGYGFSNCNGCWHGQLTFGACCALTNNHYGTAGSSGGWNIKPLLIKATSDIDTVTTAIYIALYNGADVIHETLGFECGWWCRTFGGGGDLSAMVNTAKNGGAIFVTPAMNQGKDISDSDVMPCNRDGAVCVGAIRHDGSAADYSNWGTIIDIWSPTDLLSTITRDSANMDPNDTGIDELQPYGGTSAATPFLTGIVALMKMVNPNVTYDQVRSILVSTSNASTDLKVRDRGYVDALRAVMAASPNLPPSVNVLQPANGGSEQYSNVLFSAQVTDPEVPNPYGGRSDFPTKIEFVSDLDGLLCGASGDATGSGTILSCEVAEMSAGTHLVTATATDPFGGIGTDTVSISVINLPPVTRITFPADGATYSSNQQVNFRGYAFDAEVYGFIPVSWSSSLSGPLGSSYDFWVSLPVGDHQVTLTATDEKGAVSSASIMVHVESATGGGGYPQVQITQPANGTIFGPGDLVTLTGQATDPEDGNITADSAYRWSSSEDGFLGTGTTLQTTLSVTGESTVHIITLEVTDSDGHIGTHSINVAVVNLL